MKRPAAAAVGWTLIALALPGFLVALAWVYAWLTGSWQARWLANAAALYGVAFAVPGALILASAWSRSARARPRPTRPPRPGLLVGGWMCLAVSLVPMGYMWMWLVSWLFWGDVNLDAVAYANTGAFFWVLFATAGAILITLGQAKGHPVDAESPEISRTHQKST